MSNALRSMAGPDGRIPVRTGQAQAIIPGQSIPESTAERTTAPIRLRILCERCGDHLGVVRATSHGPLLVVGSTYATLSDPAGRSHRFTFTCCGQVLTWTGQFLADSCTDPATTIRVK
jgi:hypothetical protein